MKELNDKTNQWIVDMFKKDYVKDLDENKEDYLITIINENKSALDKSITINNLTQFMNIMALRKSNKFSKKMLILTICATCVNIFIALWNIYIILDQR